MSKKLAGSEGLLAEIRREMAGLGPTGTSPRGPSPLSLLGNAALRVGKKILWDPFAMPAVNAPEADAFIQDECRKGWEIG